MEDDLGMIQTNLATDEMVEPADQEVEEHPNPIQVLLLTNQTILISEIDEVLADIGQPDCKLINPCIINDSHANEKNEMDGKLERWMSDLTPNREMFISSDKILTLVDPTSKLLFEYNKTIA